MYYTIELSSHSHVVVPWVLAIKNENNQIYVAETLVDILNEHLEESTSNLTFSICTTSTLNSQLFFSFFSIKNRPKIIVTSSPESRMSPKLLLSIFLISLHSPKILCIRNSANWTWNRRKLTPRYNSNISLINRMKIWILNTCSFQVERLLLTRAKKIVFESIEQKRILSKQYKIEHSLVFSGRLRNTAVKSNNSSKKIIPDTTHIGIGLLGTINSNKRDYTELQEAISILKLHGKEIHIYFLGSFIGIESGSIIESFGNNVKFAADVKNTYVKESKIMELIDNIEVLLSPFNELWRYSEGESSGALGDAIFYEKPILIPKFAEKIFGFKGINYYENAVDLAEKIMSSRTLMQPNALAVPLEALIDFLAVANTD